MLTGYLNYPNRQVTSHGKTTCSDIRKMHKANQRNVHITPSTLSQEIQQFAQGKYRFSANPSINDMWLEIDFNDQAFELAVFNYIHRLLSKRYTRFRNAVSTPHC